MNTNFYGLWCDPTGNRTRVADASVADALSTRPLMPEIITRFQFTEILLKIGFIEEMRTTRDNKVVPQIFFHHFPYSRK